MPNWKDVITHFAVNVEDHFDRLKYGLSQRLRRPDPYMIQPYRGCGTEEKFFLKGRVLQDKGIVPAEDNDSIWDNLVNMYRRFESDEVPHARIMARFQGEEQEVRADEEGFFDVWIQPKTPMEPDQLWQKVELELLEPLLPDSGPVRAEGPVFVPGSQAKFAVISDIDDTVLKTDATHLIQMARTVFLGNARTRLPFPGVAAFYRALYHGRTGDQANPLFFVSSGPWNLYDLLSDFFNLQDIPIGPILFLRDWGISEEEILPIRHRSHKMKAIRQLMDLYQDLPFILLGDSGQEDPEIYAEILASYPDRVKAIYIRNVSRNLKRPDAIKELAKQVAEAGSTLILADDTLPLAQHALEQGWIAPETLAEIEDRKEADQQPPTPIETLLGTEPEPTETAPTLKVEADDAEVAKDAVDDGVIEEALQVNEDETEKPPTVIIEGDEEKQEDPKDS